MEHIFDTALVPAGGIVEGIVSVFHIVIVVLFFGGALHGCYGCPFGHHRCCHWQKAVVCGLACIC